MTLRKVFIFLSMLVGVDERKEAKENQQIELLKGRNQKKKKNKHTMLIQDFAVSCCFGLLIPESTKLT